MRSGVVPCGIVIALLECYTSGRVAQRGINAVTDSAEAGDPSNDDSCVRSVVLATKEVAVWDMLGKTGTAVPGMTVGRRSVAPAHKQISIIDKRVASGTG